MRQRFRITLPSQALLALAGGIIGGMLLDAWKTVGSMAWIVEQVCTLAGFLFLACLLSRDGRVDGAGEPLTRTVSACSQVRGCWVDRGESAPGTCWSRRQGFRPRCSVQVRCWLAPADSIEVSSGVRQKQKPLCQRRRFRELRQVTGMGTAG